MLLASGFHTIFKLVNAVLLCTMSTAVENTLGFHTVTDHAAAAMGTGGCQGMDGTLKAVEDMGSPCHVYFKALVVYVAAYLTSSAVVPI
jgi:hypothetical protein